VRWRDGGLVEEHGRRVRRGVLVSVLSAAKLVSSVSRPEPKQAMERGVRAEFILVDVTTASLTRISGLIDAGKLNTLVGSVLTLAEAPIAHEMLAGLRPRQPGKIVLELGKSARVVAN
jgi:NADPH:quinone reductase-like Zn-dependent oxidoreductase